MIWRGAHWVPSITLRSNSPIPAGGTLCWTLKLPASLLGCARLHHQFFFFGAWEVGSVGSVEPLDSCCSSG